MAKNDNGDFILTVSAPRTGFPDVSRALDNAQLFQHSICQSMTEMIDCVNENSLTGLGTDDASCADSSRLSTDGAQRVRSYFAHTVTFFALLTFVYDQIDCTYLVCCVDTVYTINHLTRSKKSLDRRCLVLHYQLMYQISTCVDIDLTKFTIFLIILLRNVWQL